MVQLESLLKSARKRKARSLVKKLSDTKKILIKQNILTAVKERKGIKEALDTINICGAVKMNGSNAKREAKKSFFKCTDYQDSNVLLGEGSYGEVFLVTKDNTSFAVKIVEINQEISFLDEIKLSLLFSNEKIGPTVYGFYRVNTPGRKMSGYGFIIMEKMDKTLNEYLMFNSLSKDKEKLLFTILQKKVKLGVMCTDIKPSNIMIKYKDSKLDIKLIDFGEFCCDIYPEYNDQTSLELLEMLLAYTIKYETGKTIFRKDIEALLSNPKKFSLLIKVLTEKTQKCNIIDIYQDTQTQETFGKKVGRQINHYAVKNFIKKYNLKKGATKFSDTKPYYLDEYFGEVGSKKAIKQNKYKENQLKEVWATRVIATIIYILNGEQSSYEGILPEEIFLKLVKNNKYLYSKNVKFSQKKTRKKQVKPRKTRKKQVKPRKKTRSKRKK